MTDAIAPTFQYANAPQPGTLAYQQLQRPQMQNVQLTPAMIGLAPGSEVPGMPGYRFVTSPDPESAAGNGGQIQIMLDPTGFATQGQQGPQGPNTNLELDTVTNPAFGMIAGAAIGTAMGTNFGSWEGTTPGAGGYTSAGASTGTNALPGWSNALQVASNGNVGGLGAAGAPADPIEAIYQLTAGTNMTATQAAAAAGFPSTEAYLSSINPAWVGAGGVAAGAAAASAAGSAAGGNRGGAAGTPGFLQYAQLALGGLGAYSALQGINAQGQATNQQGQAANSIAQAADRQNAIAQQQLSLANEQWDYWRTNFGPLGTTIAAQANLPPDYERATREAQQDTQNASDTAWNSYSRNRADTSGSGWNPGSPNYQAALQAWGNRSALGSAAAVNAARNAERDRSWSRMTQAYGLGSGIPQQVNAATGAAGSTNSGAISGYNALASNAGTLAANAGNNAAQGAYVAGRALQGWNQPYNPTSFGGTPAATAPASNGYNWNPGGSQSSEQAYWGTQFADGGHVRAIRTRAKEQARHAFVRRGALPGFAEGGAVSAMQLSPQDEATFQQWYGQFASQHGLNPNPDDPNHQYDYRAAFSAGQGPDQTGHWPSEHKRAGHPRTFVNPQDQTQGSATPVPGWMHTPTGQMVPPNGMPQPTSALPGYANGGSAGGVIEGPGTGTSDSISANLPDDSFIIPKDVRDAKGDEFFDKLDPWSKTHHFTGALGGGVHAAVSNGERVISEHAVRSKGVEFFDKLLEKYHTPVHAEGNANGGKPRVALPPMIEAAINGSQPHRALGRF